MILLDTNVLSEPSKLHPDAQALAWLDRQRMDTLFISTVSIAEMRYGIACLPEGRRKTALNSMVEDILLPRFAGRILNFDINASATFATIMSVARFNGLAIGFPDGCIAAIAASNGLTVATRDSRPFEAAGLKVINPWARNTNPAAGA